MPQVGTGAAPAAAPVPAAPLPAVNQASKVPKASNKKAAKASNVNSHVY